MEPPLWILVIAAVFPVPTFEAPLAGWSRLAADFLYAATDVQGVT
jgi:hypothetical protein